MNNVVMPSGQPSPEYILYADDDQHDRRLFIEAMAEVQPSLQIMEFDNGQLLMDHLDNLPKKDKLPSCIILDLNMPGKNGFSTLEEVKKTDRYSSVPVYILTTASKSDSIGRFGKQCADQFFTKPQIMDEMMDITQQICSLCKKNTPFNLLRRLQSWD